MTRSIYDNKKSRGRPKTGIGTLVGVRLNDVALKMLDDWRRKQEDLPGRPEAIRRLVDLGLGSKKR
ncbi:hypothetical protein XI07_13190 [Bradyrhizobium sp. CCBAU 11445]|nr:hypothetical protein [Bradyrhizobium sp. CCBAU 11445]